MFLFFRYFRQLTLYSVHSPTLILYNFEIEYVFKLNISKFTSIKVWAMCIKTMNFLKLRACLKFLHGVIHFQKASDICEDNDWVRVESSSKMDHWNIK